MAPMRKLVMFLDDRRRLLAADAGALVLRLFGGFLMMAGHGYGKLAGFGGMKDTFPNPFGIGSMPSLALATFAEFFCALAIIFGFATRLASIPLIITMGTAAFIIHANDPWFAANAAGGGSKEFALIYLTIFLAILLIGPGRVSVDRIIEQKLGK